MTIPATPPPLTLLNPHLITVKSQATSPATTTVPPKAPPAATAFVAVVPPCYSSSSPSLSPFPSISSSSFTPITNLHVQSFNIKPNDHTLQTKFIITIRDENPNEKIGIAYRKGSQVLLTNHDLNISSGKHLVCMHVRVPVVLQMLDWKLRQVTVNVDCDLVVGDLSPGKETVIKSSDYKINVEY